MTLRALIVDDERFARVALAELLRERGDVVVVGEATSVEAAAEQLAVTSPDVLFLDIRLRDASGFALFERSAVDAHVIFVTAYAEHALRAFEVDALDYLVKPVQRRALDRALAKAHGRAPSTQPPRWPPHTYPSRMTSPLVDSLRLEDRVCLQRGNDIVFARACDIVFLRAARDYTEIHLASGRSQRVKESLQRWRQRLPEPPFCRIHRSLLINSTYLERLWQEDGAWSVRLATVERSLPVSRRLLGPLREGLR